MKVVLRYLVHHIGNVLRFGQRLYYRLYGIHIGRRTMVSLGAKIDVHRGQISIGDDCLITHGCVIVSHDGAAKMVRPGATGEGRVVIGDNVFLGVNTIVLPNVTIGSNTVIGAGSLVVHDIPAGVLAFGSPARVIRQLPTPYPRLTSNSHRDAERESPLSC